MNRRPAAPHTQRAKRGDVNRTAVGSAVNGDDDDDWGVTSDAKSAAGANADEVALFDREDEDENFEVAANEPAKIELTSEEPDEAEDGGGDLPMRLGGYEVLKVLGKGGMGAVLLGRQLSLNRKVALKVMHPKIAENPAYVARFTREAYAAAQLTHHNVVQIYDIGEDKGQHFFSMEFVQGQSLMELVRAQGRLAPEAAVGYILQAARGLRQGHKQGMVHRDIKPANLMVNDEGIVKVADLGLVKLSKDGPESDNVLTGLGGNDMELTGAGKALGTPAYMAPEQATGSSSVDHRADIYSLGCTLYALVTGRPPFDGTTAVEVMSKHLTEPVVPPEMIVRRVPGALSAILMRMLAKEPDDRYQSMDEVIAALEGFLGMPRSGTFTPSEHETDRLEACANTYHEKSRAGLKPIAITGFVAACVAVIVGSALFGRPIFAVKAFMLLCLAPPLYFVIHGIFSGGVVYSRARALVFGMRAIDWLMTLGALALFLGTLALFGLLVAWLKLVVLALVLSFYLWEFTDRKRDEARREPLRDGQLLCRMLRGQGLSEDQLRAFVCKYGGAYWEQIFEALFGYEAKISARALRTGAATGPWKPFAAWRDPIVAWADARLETRRRAREQKLLQKLEAKALRAEGLSASEADARAGDLAAVLVDQANEARKAQKEGKDADLRGMVKAARTGKPKPGYNIAGKRLRDRALVHFLNEWFGRRLRFALAVLLLAVGAYWMHQNQVFDDPIKEHPVVVQFKSGRVLPALNALCEPSGQPLTVGPVPAKLTTVVDSYRVPLTGFCLLVSAAFLFGWRASIPALVGALVALAGPALGVPDFGMPGPALLSLGAGMLVILVGGWLLRK